MLSAWARQTPWVGSHRGPRWVPGTLPLQLGQRSCEFFISMGSGSRCKARTGPQAAVWQSSFHGFGKAAFGPLETHTRLLDEMSNHIWSLIASPLPTPIPATYILDGARTQSPSAVHLITHAPKLWYSAMVQDVEGGT